jgi:hypothetical protein
VRKQFRVPQTGALGVHSRVGTEFGVKGKITHYVLQIEKLSWIDSKLKTQNSKLQRLKGAAP